MTPDQMRAEERNAALTAVAHALTADEQALFMSTAVRRWPKFAAEGVTPADVLDYTTDYDEFLNETEPFFERFAAQLPAGVNYAPVFAAHVIILLRRELTPGRVIALLQRAGVTEVPRYPGVEAGLWAYEVDRDHGGCDANHLLVRARAEQGMRAAGIPESVVTEFREGVRATGIPGYGQNMADIARWVTLVDRYTEMPRKGYDPTDDIAVVLAWASAEPGDPDDPALANLRSHLDLRSPETIKSSLLPFYGREV